MPRWCPAGHGGVVGGCHVSLSGCREGVDVWIVVVVIQCDQDQCQF